VADEVFGIGRPLKDERCTSVGPPGGENENGTGVHFSPSLLFELLTYPCVLRRYLKEKSIKKYTVHL
jgi:hypothetical protein